ncbi:zinc transporter ZntB [Sedimentisphaera salicampi]|uniref:Zinc transport protein ZntB n=1 Tax=Sedimentisphaera salicampi TaxID=1941349 RepID=A0A1W6LMC6_9BACT|nr:zinc transporter ZntB [Sedimentisphaera salicampi]ARN56893.1 Zinc transport protein ZntB [Sedimentisphaera salicampi]OXU15062.1 Zinc transport protein ZntB [Sedimentisphaera salicampi]
MAENGLIYFYIMDGDGSAQEGGWQEIEKWLPEQGPCWLHLDYTASDPEKWLAEKSGLDEATVSALLSEESRPRVSIIDKGALIALRGVNLSPNSEPEDMVAIRLWVDENRIISTRKRKLLSENDIIQSFIDNKGPKTTGEFISDLAEHLIGRIESTVQNIEDGLDDLEEQLIATESYDLRTDLSEIRREAIMLRRYLNPQKEAMARLQTDRFHWLSENNRRHLRETNDNLIRYTEDLDSIRDRAAVAQEQLAGKLSEQLNSRMYILSLVAALFLPLSFLTGLLGINVAGIPGAEAESAFWIFILILAAAVITQIIIFKRKKWL